MAIINAITLPENLYAGEAPVAVAHGFHTLAAAQINDVVRLCKMPAGTKVYEAKLVNAALGASTTVSLGYEYVNGEAAANATAFLGDTSTVAAATTRAPGAPVILQYDAYLTATVKGGAATGKIDAVLQYEYRGK